MKDLFLYLCNCLEQGQEVAVASIVAQQGSAPRGTGAWLVANAEGLLMGSIGGGLAEGEVLQACRNVLQTKTSCLLDFVLTGAMAAKSDMICGGRVRVLIEPLCKPKQDALFFRAAIEAMETGQAVLVTNITDPSRPQRSIWDGRTCVGTVLESSFLTTLLAAIEPTQEALLYTTGKEEYLIEPLLPPLRMIIAGGGHISRPTAQIASMAGFEVTVVDDRPEFSQAARFPWAVQVHTIAEYHDCFAASVPDARSYIIIVTRGHLYDATVLEQALHTKAGYIGMIGSTRKRGEVYAALRAQGVTDQDLARVHCPIGLPIGAKTPEEIAVSIVAQCIEHRRTCA